MTPAKDSLSPSIDAFLAMAAVEQGLACNTLEAYGRDLAKLSEFLVAHGVYEWQSVDSLQIRSFIRALRSRGLSPRSIARHVVTMRRLCRFLETEGLLKKNPLPEVLLPPGPRKLPQTLSGEDMGRLLGQPDPAKPLGAGRGGTGEAKPP